MGKKGGQVKPLCSDIKPCIFPLIYNQSFTIKKEEIEYCLIGGVVSMSLMIGNLPPEVTAFGSFLR